MMMRIAVLAVVLVTVVPRTAAADLGGYNWVNPGITVRQVDEVTIVLARNTFAASFNVLGAPNPHVVWGDGNLDPNAASNLNNVSWRNCEGIFNAENCELVATHQYFKPGAFVVHV